MKFEKWEVKNLQFLPEIPEPFDSCDFAEFPLDCDLAEFPDLAEHPDLADWEDLAEFSELADWADWDEDRDISLPLGDSVLFGRPKIKKTIKY